MGIGYDFIFSAVLDDCKVARESWNGKKYTELRDNKIVLVDSETKEIIKWPVDDQANDCSQQDWMILT